MNILFTCSARKWGGNEAWVLNAVSILSKKHHVIVAYRKDIVGERFNTTTYQLPFYNEADIYTLVKLIHIIKKNRIDIIIPTKRKDYFLAGVACIVTKAKNILILGIVRDLKNSIINNIIYNKLAHGIIVNANAIKDVLLQSPYINADDVAVVPNGLTIDEEKIYPFVEKKANYTITSLGELSQRKGFDFLIKGFALFIKQHNITDAALNIIGTGGELQVLQHIATSLHVERLVTFSGFIKNPFPYLATTDVFALTSINEGIPYATLEAALLDNAIISTRAGGIEEIFTDYEHCLFVDYGDEQQLADTLFLLYKNTQLRKTLAINAKNTVQQKFSLEKMETDMVDFFQKKLLQ